MPQASGKPRGAQPLYPAGVRQALLDPQTGPAAMREALADQETRAPAVGQTLVGLQTGAPMPV